MKKKVYFLLTCLLAVQCSMAQFYHRAASYNVYDDTLFVATKNGIIYYPLQENGADWKTYAFNNMMIQSFVKSDSKLLAIYQSETGYELLRSSDYGNTFADITPEDGAKANYLYYSIYQMPDNPEHVFLVYPPNDVNSFQNNRMMESHDLGRNWTAVEKATIQDGFFAVDPYNPGHIIVYGLQPYVNCICPYILETTDNFNTLNNVPFDYEPSFYFHSLSFCSSNTQKLLAATSLGLFKSIDGGLTWQKDCGLSDLNWWESHAVILYEPNHSQFVFVGGARDIHYSKDSGETWQQFYTLESDTDEEIVGMLYYNDNIIVVSSHYNVYCVPLNQDPSSVSSFKQENVTKRTDSYNLQGQRLNAASHKGIYIQNGKKYVVIK